MKSLSALALILLTGSVCATTVPKLEPADVIAARSNMMFPVTTYALDVEVPCYSKVVGTVETIQNGEAMIGVMLQDLRKPGQPSCMGLAKKTFRLSVTATVVRDVTILGAPKDIRIEPMSR